MPNSISYNACYTPIQNWISDCKHQPKCICVDFSYSFVNKTNGDRCCCWFFGCVTPIEIGVNIFSHNERVNRLEKLTRFGSLQMECRFVFGGWWCWPLGCVIARTDAIQIEIIAAVEQSGLLAIDIAEIGTRLGLLIESRSIRAQKSEILHLPKQKQKRKKN